MRRKTRPSNPTITKRLTKSRVYYYYDKRTKKRISKATYYRRLRNYRPRQKKKTTKKFKKTAYKGRFAVGNTYTFSTNVLFSNYSIQQLTKKIDGYYQQIRQRLKPGNHFVYLRLRGYLITPDEKVLFHRNTARSFIKEYRNNDYRTSQISDVLETIFELFGESRYSADDFQLTQVSINKRKDA